VRAKSTHGRSLRGPRGWEQPAQTQPSCPCVQPWGHAAAAPWHSTRRRSHVPQTSRGEPTPARELWHALPACVAPNRRCLGGDQLRRKATEPTGAPCAGNPPGSESRVSRETSFSETPNPAKPADCVTKSARTLERLPPPLNLPPVGSTRSCGAGPPPAGKNRRFDHDC
jgi:hypothetical protein